MRNFIRHPSDIPIAVHYAGRLLAQPQPLNNISLGGLSLQTDMYLERESMIDIEIPVVKPAFRARARVIWCRKKDDHYDVGAEFVETGETFKARMVEQVCYIEHYKNEVREKEGRELSGREAALEWISKYAKDFK
jgi:hypothetical protein